MKADGVMRFTRFDNGWYCTDPGRFPKDGTCPYIDPYNGHHCIRPSFSHDHAQGVKSAHQLSVNSHYWYKQVLPKPANSKWRLCGRCS